MTLQRFIAAALAAAACSAFAQDAPQNEFTWRARLEVPAGANVARIALPADALAALQSGDARDLRVFNGKGEPVGYALTRPVAPAPAAAQSRVFNAYPLYAAAPGVKHSRGSVQVKVDGGTDGRAVWVQLEGNGGAKPANAQALDAALFTTQDQKLTITALSVLGELPANAPVEMTLSTSPDLSQWTEVPLRGRLFRFDGENAPRNLTLALERPLSLEGKYLRLSWEGQAGVKVTGITGTVSSGEAPAGRVRAALPAGTQSGNALEWQLPYATPMAALALSPKNANTIAPVRVLGRNDAAQPWQFLGSGVVYKVGDNVNPPVTLNGASVRTLRVEATQGPALSPGAVEASVEFLPVEVAFLVAGEGPFVLAAGRARTGGAALAPEMLVAAAGKKMTEMPQARVGEVLKAGAGGGSFIDRIVPGQESRSLVLWLVLGAGVIVLGGAAFALMRQLR
ncbi:MAG: DUF3999 family protein [Burkholderiaceae bacterium]